VSIVDGTLLLSSRSLGDYAVLPGAIEVLSTLKERHVPFALLTNGSAYPPAEQAAKLRDVGLPVDDGQNVHAPSSIAADHMQRRGIRRALVLGTAGVGYALRAAGNRDGVHRRSRCHGSRQRLRRVASGVRNEGHRDRLSRHLGRR